MSRRRARRRRILFLFLATLAGALALTANDPSPQSALSGAAPGTEPAGAEESEEAEADERGEREDWFFRQHYGTEPPTPADFSNAVAQAENIQSLTADRYPGLLDPNWNLAGPTDVGGRIADLVVDPTQPNTIYTASAAGGVWKSTDANVSNFTMQKAWPEDNAQAIGALAITPSGALYAGTGESNPTIPSFPGDGVYKSTDGGATWRHLGLPQAGTIGRIAIDPTNPNRIFVAAAGFLFTPGGQRGLYRSDDGGETWQLVLAGETGFTGAVDVAINPVSPNRVYAAMWDHHRGPSFRNLGGVGSGLFRSDDGGETWTRLQTITNPGNTELNSSPDVGRIGIAIAPSNPNRVYVIAATSNSTGISGNFRGFYWSNDGGDTFTEATPSNNTLANSQSTFAWWFGRLYVDPANAERVFVSGVSLVASTNPTAVPSIWANSGGNVGGTGGLHADQHTMAWDPAVPGRVYLGNDGGTYRSDTNGVSGSWRQAGFEPISQFYTMDVSQQNIERIAGGMQDTSCVRNWTSAGVGTGQLFNDFMSCGDGLTVLINPVDNNRVYACSQGGSCRRSSNAGNTSQAFGATTSLRRNWEAPVLFDKTDPSIMYYAGTHVNRSINHAQNWTAISPDLTGGPSTDPASTFGTITGLDVSKTEPNTLWAGTDDGRVWKTTDLGVSWTRIEDPALPDRWVTTVAIDPTNPNRVYLTYSGFRQGDNNAHVLRTDDAGETWTNISGNLPVAPVNDVIVHPTGTPVVLGTDVGVFVSKAGTARWFQLGDGLPQTPTMDVNLHVGENVVFAGTHGRSIFRLDLDRETDPPVTTATLSPDAVNGWYVDPTVTLTADDGPGAGVDFTEYRLDGGAWQTYTGPFQVTGDGDRTLEYRSVDKAENAEAVKTLSFKVDGTKPTISLVTPVDGANYLIKSTQLADYACADATSGVAGCVGTVADGSAIDTSSVGFHTFTVNATDVAGNTQSSAVTYNIIWPFFGFFEPLDDNVNKANAGKELDIRFSLGGFRGYDILADGYPASQRVSCSSGAPLGPLEETRSEDRRALEFKYDRRWDDHKRKGRKSSKNRGYYEYEWDTSRRWEDTCRKLVVRLVDNTEHTTIIRFK